MFSCNIPCGHLSWQQAYLTFRENTDAADAVWHYDFCEMPDHFQWNARPQKQQPLPAGWTCTVAFDDLQCDQLLTNGESMGNCHIFAAGNQRKEFESCNFLLLRFDKNFVLLEVVSEAAGEVFWCGVWESGLVSKLRIELRERFAKDKPIPEISMRITSGADAGCLIAEWFDRHYSAGRLKPAEKGAAWSSWDYYRWCVTAEDVLANAEFIARDPVLSKHISRIVIDDGWMNCYGEWEPNSRFRDMPGLVKELNKMNFSAGLWFAPTIAEPQSMIAQKHWEWLARGESNWPCLAYECMSRQGFLLDPTRKEVQKYFYELFQHYRAMGFDYFKLDFLKHTLRARKFYDQHADANEIMRSIVRPIRQAVGDDTILMGCNYLFNAGNDYLDIVRCASDIAARTDCVKDNSTSIAVRLPFHNRLWYNDPDFAVVRGRETSDDPEIDLLRPNQVYITADAGSGDFDDFCGKWTCGGEMPGSEAEILLSLILISGGEMTFSDALPKLNAYGLDLVRKAASALRGPAGTADDLLQGEFVQKFTQQVNSNYWRKLWINWKSEEQAVTLTDLPENVSGLKDFWRGTELSKDQTVILPADSCLLLDVYI